MEKTHKGKIDLIYIDPPYNRGNDFIYDDLKISKTDAYIHSQWISFMKVRLEIARKLLSLKGAIFISIGDEEQANLKLLCDEIFGEQNFAGTIPWRKRTANTVVPFGISQDFEWILVYAKSDKFNVFSKRENERKYYSTPDIVFPDGSLRPWRIHDLTKQTSASERPNSNFTMINPKTGEKYPANLNATWRITVDTFNTYYDAKKIVFPGDYDFLKISKPVMRYFKDDDEMKALKKTGNIDGISSISTLLPNSVGMTEDGTKDMLKIFDSKVFPFPKPVSLIKYLIKIGTVNKKKPIILDFFAGSGTTAHAVIELNNELKDNKRFILVTNNESNICKDITYPRIKKVITGYDYEDSNDTILLSKKITFRSLKSSDRIIDKVNSVITENKSKYDEIKPEIKGGILNVTGTKKKNIVHVDGLPASLKYFKVDYIPISEKFYYEFADELLKHVRELVELENGINFTCNEKIAIILTDKELTEFIKNIDSFKKCRKIYLGHDVLPDGIQEQIFKDRKITINIIPDYYYRDLEG